MDRVAERLAGKVALVTGGGGGIGEATAHLFWEEGAAVALVDNQHADLDEVMAGISRDGQRLAAISADLSHEAEAERAVRETVKRFGKLDVLVNLAAVRAPIGPVTNASVEDWQRIVGVNLLGIAYCCKFAIPEMIRAGGGSIVNVSSANALVPRPGWALYDATKSAILALTRDMACDHAAQGIRVNALCPGSVLTKFHIRNRAREQGVTYETAEANMREAAVGNLLQRYAEPREMAYAVLFLACSESSFATGSILRVDGGLVG